jgi:hypothetical protein
MRAAHRQPPVAAYKRLQYWKLDFVIFPDNTAGKRPVQLTMTARAFVRAVINRLIGIIM